jgi:hypothetical protein
MEPPMPNKFNITASPIRNVILASGAAMTRPRGHISKVAQALYMLD